MIQNLVWATGYNIVALPLAAGGLASRGVVLSPALGAVFVSLSTMIVALNAQLLRGLRLRGTETWAGRVNTSWRGAQPETGWPGQPVSVSSPSSRD